VGIIPDWLSTPVVNHTIVTDQYLTAKYRPNYHTLSLLNWVMAMVLQTYTDADLTCHIMISAVCECGQLQIMSTRFHQKHWRRSASTSRDSRQCMQLAGDYSTREMKFPCAGRCDDDEREELRDLYPVVW